MKRKLGDVDYLAQCGAGRDGVGGATEHHLSSKLVESLKTTGAEEFKNAIEGKDQRLFAIGEVASYQRNQNDFGARSASA